MVIHKENKSYENFSKKGAVGEDSNKEFSKELRPIGREFWNPEPIGREIW